MVLAIPVAVRFLQRGNRELSRNMSSYLSLAAIAEADLLAEHTEAITLSVLGGRTHMSHAHFKSVCPLCFTLLPLILYNSFHLLSSRLVSSPLLELYLFCR